MSNEPRSVTHVIDTVRVLEGGGFPVRRPFPTATLDHIDPFLLLDHFGPIEWGPNQAIGAPAHPHRGFETVSYILAGAMMHSDSAGNQGKLGPGDVQWMTAGAGVIHSELPDPEFKRRGGVMHGFQIWVNLPASDKMMAPRYLVYVFAGALEVGGRRVREGQLARLSDAGETIEFSTQTATGDASERAELLLLAGVPLDEPVARHGPFVMNTREQLIEAFADYQAGRLTTRV